MTTTNNSSSTYEKEIIVFGDFTSSDIDFLKKASTSRASTYYSGEKNTLVIFGDFSPFECASIQTGLNQETQPQVQVANIYYDIPCGRCGYHSHSVDKCVARRNRYGELIRVPKKYNLPPLSPIYYNTHLSLTGDKTDYAQFKFTKEEVEEWIEEDKDAKFVDYLYYKGQYVVCYKVYYYQQNQLGYNLRPCEKNTIEPDYEIECALRYNYLETRNMIYGN